MRYLVLLSLALSTMPSYPGRLTSLLTKENLSRNQRARTSIHKFLPARISPSPTPLAFLPPSPSIPPETERILHLVPQIRAPNYTMDTTRQAIEDADLSKLNDKDKGELRQFLALESKRSEVQASTSCLSFP